MLNIKRILLLLSLVTSLVVNGYAQKTPGSFVLKGKYNGPPPAPLYLYYTNDKSAQVKDSAVIKDGAFSFTGNIAEPTMAYLLAKQSGSSNEIQLFIEPAVMTLTLDGNIVKNAILKGSDSQKDWEQLSKQKEPIRKEMEPLSAKLTAANQAYAKAKKENLSEKELDTLKYRAAAIHDEFNPYHARMAKEDFHFFEKHPTSIVTAFYLRFYVSSLSLDSLRLFYDRLGDRVQQMTYGKYIAGEVKKLEGGSPGSMAKNFATTNIGGNPLQLSDFKGKYVLLDFWASWCVPCRKGNPHLKELYTMYKDKGFEVIGVSDDDRDNDAWKKAVDKDGLPWQHVLRGLKYDPAKGFDRSTDISELFGIHTLPTQILIDPSGKIIARYGESSSPHEELDKTLATVFK